MFDRGNEKALGISFNFVNYPRNACNVFELKWNESETRRGDGGWCKIEYVTVDDLDGMLNVE